MMKRLVSEYTGLNFLEIEQLEYIRYLQWQLPLIHGNAGTSFWGPALCFKNWGFPVNVIVDRKRFDAEATAADCCILFYHWRKKAKFGAHFVALHHTEKGFVGYNTYSNSKGPDDWTESMEAFLKQKKYFGAVLIGIKDKRGM